MQALCTTVYWALRGNSLKEVLGGYCAHFMEVKMDSEKWIQRSQDACPGAYREEQRLKAVGPGGPVTSMSPAVKA